MEISEALVEKYIEAHPEREEQIRELSNRNKVKIPISRTYHQVGIEDSSSPVFKYQSSYSTSWGIPQVAGLLAVLKELDRNLTFEQLVEYAEKTAQTEHKIINPTGIYKEIERVRDERLSVQDESNEGKNNIIQPKASDGRDSDR